MLSREEKKRVRRKTQKTKKMGDHEAKGRFNKWDRNLW